MSGICVIPFTHSIGDTVEIAHVKGITGVVTMLRAAQQGNGYLVVWWHDGRRLEEWLLDFEIKAVGK